MQEKSCIPAIFLFTQASCPGQTPKPSPRNPTQLRHRLESCLPSNWGGSPHYVVGCSKKGAEGS